MANGRTISQPRRTRIRTISSGVNFLPGSTSHLMREKGHERGETGADAAPLQPWRNAGRELRRPAKIVKVVEIFTRTR